ncbi:ABC transporter permease [Gordonia jinhuaensis]|uniref:Polyamine ABC transporter permease n=1 Tax=Gordonia jinhuaensis TaxID=1517702 RepID=A0A916T3W3_9ACTN|nr:ABC transporter permease subunit [Gordonia jinhuaensis]GGB27660.1 polyamine ABC transporter permease [Gordonia jinhuaensis]
MTWIRRWWDDPWRKPRVLATITAFYLLWSLLPIVIAILFSFNSGRSRSVWQGFSTRWYFGSDQSVLGNDTLHSAIVQTLWLGLLTTLITVPLGAALGIGLDRWRGRIPSGVNGITLISFVVPETLLAVAILFVVTNLALPVSLGTSAQVIGLVTFQLSYPAVLVRSRLATIGTQYEEAAMDLGASPLQAQLRVILPMLAPAIVASAVLVFADVIDDFVLVRYLSGSADTEPISVLIYNSARSSPTPALNALATILLAAAMIAIALGFAVFRWLGRRSGNGADLSVFAGEA